MRLRHDAVYEVEDRMAEIAWLLRQAKRLNEEDRIIEESEFFAIQNDIEFQAEEMVKAARSLT